MMRSHTQCHCAAVALAALSTLAIAMPLVGCRGNGGPVRQVMESPAEKDQAAPAEPKIVVAPDADFARYASVFVAEVVVGADATQGDDVKPEQLRQLADDLRKDLKSALGARRKVVDVVGPDTLVVKSFIVRAVPNSPLRNLAPQTQVRKAGYGYAAIFVEVVDPQRKGQLLTFSHERSTERFSLDKLSEWGSVEKSFEVWASEIAEKLK
jgi:hypothetical protein